ncbi:allantoinase [Halosimplex carlsbadense 2-9-1]|uniref:Allantoinase n=1 Tax=Halosimplex carlsbadense 2-9-1 TaxID=797114 RepID=M0CWD4_9EURY|nr:hypothetical protein [Halosimplex carlsbadense]ELZ27521.1 allantoinase [Halosimplex carlsbadense 2-9-1]
MTVDFGVRNGTLVGADGMADADLLVDGSLVMPGIVDPHVHIAQGSPTDTYETGSEAAALGGVTKFVTFVSQPPDGPELTLHEAVEFVVFDPEATQTIRAADNVSVVDFSIYEGREVTGVVERTTSVAGVSRPTATSSVTPATANPSSVPSRTGRHSYCLGPGGVAGDGRRADRNRRRPPAGVPEHAVAPVE